MSNVVAIQNQSEQELINVLQNSLYPGAATDSVKMVLSYCKAAQLDPIQKPVHIVPMWDSKAGAMRDVVMPGIGLYRIQASRSGEMGGVSEPEFGEDVTQKIGGQEITFPRWCKVTVSRLIGGTMVHFTAKEFWMENYAVKGGKDKSIAPNAMWTKRPYAQIAKCAEAQALRKAFPEFGAAPTAEEMEGKDFNGERDITPPRQEQVDTRPEYPEERFEAKKMEWVDAIRNGKTTAENIIAFVESKSRMTEEQKAALRNVKPAETIEGDLL
jgi:phage recombination protein Bet